MERTESVSFLLSSPLPGSSQVAGFLFSVSQKNRARYSYLSRWELFPFLMEQRYEISNKLQIITVFISIELTYFKHCVFYAITALTNTPESLLLHPLFADIVISSFLAFMYLIGSGHVQMLWHISIAQPPQPDASLCSEARGFPRIWGKKKQARRKNISILRTKAGTQQKRPPESVRQPYAKHKNCLILLHACFQKAM